MRSVCLASLCVASVLVAAVHCDPSESTETPPPTSPDASPIDSGVPSPIDAAPNTPDGGSDAGPVDTCGPREKFEKAGGTLTTSETWPVGDYLVKGTVYTSGTLTIPACTILRLAPGANLIVNTGGALKLLGGPTTKVRVTSSNPTPAAGDWGYIEFRTDSSSGDNEIHHAIIEYGGKDYGAVFLGSSASVAIDHTTIQHSETYGIEMRSGAHLRGASDNVISGSGTAPVSIHANSVGDLLSGTFTGNGADVILVVGGTINKTTSWKNLGVPYRADTLYVQGAATPQKLTLEAGVVLQLRPNQNIIANTAGGLHLAGTTQSPVKITSSENSPSAGDWGYIEFRSDSTAGDNVVENAIIEYGGKDYGAVYVAASASVKITGTTIRHSEDVGLEVVSDTSALRDFTGNTFTNNAQGPILAKANVIGQIGAGTYTGNGVDVIRVNGGTVSRNATWGDRGVAYRIDDSFYVDASSGTVTLKVEAGAKLAVGNGRNIIVNDDGVLSLAGTAAKHVVVTSAADAPVTGIWNYIELRSLGNGFTYTDISYGGGGGNASGYGQVYVSSNSSVALNNVTFASGKLCDIDKGSASTSAVSATNSPFVACP